MAYMFGILLITLAGYGALAGPLMDGPIDFGFTVYHRTSQGNAVDKASMKMLKEAYATASDKNVVASPVAVLSLLTLYADAVEGKSRDEVLRLLEEKTSDEAYSNQRVLNDRLSGNSALKFKNKVYISKDYTIADKFSMSAAGLNSDLENIDFTNVKNAVTKINDWAEKESNGHIKEAVSEDNIDPATAAALFNVIFFQGHWHVPFKASETKDKAFHVDKDTVVQKPTMTLKRALLYGENKEIGAKFLELPYQERGFRMVITLPDNIDGLPTVIEKLSVTGVLDDVFALSPAYAEVHLELPRFEIKAELDLNTILPKLGVSKIFSEPAANIVKERTVAIDKAFQKAFIKVDEEGAKAGAFTGMIAVPMSSLYKPPPPIEFKVDRPFLFSILYNDIVIFTGTYTH